MEENPNNVAHIEPIATIGATRFNKVRRPGETVDRALVSRPPAVAVAPVDLVHNRFAMIRQRRIGANWDFVVEVPAGKIDAGEDPITTARRELEEETGLCAGSIELVATDLYVSPGYTDERMSLAIATGLTDGHKRPEDAGVELLWVDVDQLPNQVALARDLKTYALLLALQARLLSRPRADARF